MRGQQVLHHVQPFGTVEIGWLAGQDVKLVRRHGLFKAFAALARRRSPGNALQLNDFRTFTHFFRDVIASHFSALHVVRRNVAHDIAFCGLTVKGDDRDFRLVCHLHGVADGIRVGGVDQQQPGAAHRQILDVRQLFRRVVLGVQHHQVVAQLVSFFLRAVFQRHEERVIQGRDNQSDGVFGHRVCADGRT